MQRIGPSICGSYNIRTVYLFYSYTNKPQFACIVLHNSASTGWYAGTVSPFQSDFCLTHTLIIDYVLGYKYYLLHTYSSRDFVSVYFFFTSSELYSSHVVSLLSCSFLSAVQFIKQYM